VAPKRASSRNGLLLGTPLVFAVLLALWVAVRQPAAVEALSNQPTHPVTPAPTSDLELAQVDQRETVAVEEPVAPEQPETAPTPAPYEPEIVDFVESGPTPPDPVQQGSALLDLQLLDTATKQPVASFVELWRLDAPENEDWTSGDQLQDQAQVPVEGWTFPNLPEGGYRIVCHAQAWDEEVAAVDVRAPRTRTTLSIVIPREFRILLDVRDRFGVQVANLHLVGRNEELLDPHDDWRTGRSLKASAGGVSIGIGRGWWGSNQWSSQGPQPADGFDLGTHAEANRGGHRREVLDFATADGRRVRVLVPPRMNGEQDLVAVAIEPGEIEPLVRVPPNSSAQVEVEVLGEAIQRDASLPGGGWERAPVSISVRGEGLRAFQHTWRPADGDLPGIVLEAEP